MNHWRKQILSGLLKSLGFHCVLLGPLAAAQNLRMDYWTRKGGYRANRGSAVYLRLAVLIVEPESFKSGLKFCLL